MLVKLCDRCGAPVPPQPGLGSVTLPAADPATAPKQVKASFTLALSLATVGGIDLCPVCLVSAFVEYALIAMKDVLTPKIARQLQERISAALGFVVGSGDATQDPAS